jgi:RimJ/RimL family protein N-acetyltransferase
LNVMVILSIKLWKDYHFTELFKYVMHELNYNHYVLEVIDTNQNAYRLYKKLGFKDIKRDQVKIKASMKKFIWNGIDSFCFQVVQLTKICKLLLRTSKAKYHKSL